MVKRIAMIATAATLFVLAAQVKNVPIGYQTIYSPWKVAVVAGKFEKDPAYKINWKQFDSGSKVITAMASGDVGIALVMRYLENKLVPWKTRV